MICHLRGSTIPESFHFTPSLSQVSEHFCPDGLVFDESSTSYAKCGFPFSIDCTGEQQSGLDNWRQSSDLR